MRLTVVTIRNIRGARNVAIRSTLTTRLADPASMTEALGQFTSKLRRYTIIIKRSSFNWDTGKGQERNLVLFEDEPAVIDGEIDSRLLKSKNVTILATTRDGGTASLNLTSRSISTWASTPELRELIEEFNKALRINARSRWITPESSRCWRGLLWYFSSSL